MPSLECVVLDSIEDENKNIWNNLVKSSRNNSFFHRFEWLFSLEKGLDVEPKHIVINKDKSPIAIFPNFINKVPNMPLKRLHSMNPGYGGPIILKHEKECMKMFFESLPDICKGNVMSHYVNTYDPCFVRYANSFIEQGYQPIIGCRFYFDLHDGPSAIMSNMSSSSRKNIAKGEKNNYAIHDELVDEASLRIFHESFKRSMKRVKGYVYPFEMFKVMGETFPEDIKIFSIYVDGEYCCGNLLFIDRSNSILYSFFSGVCERNFSMCSNYILDWHILNYCHKTGIRFCDLGPTEGDFSDGLFVHKYRYNSKMMPTVSWEKVYSKSSKMTYDLARSLFYKFNFHK